MEAGGAGRCSARRSRGGLGHAFAREDVSTVGGPVLTLFDGCRPGETLELDGFRLTVDQAVRRRVRRERSHSAEYPAGHAEPPR
jgi:Mg2+/Co2+ transporter CorC